MIITSDFDMCSLEVGFMLVVKSYQLSQLHVDPSHWALAKNHGSVIEYLLDMLKVPVMIPVATC